MAISGHRRDASSGGSLGSRRHPWWNVAVDKPNTNDEPGAESEQLATAAATEQV